MVCVVIQIVEGKIIVDNINIITTNIITIRLIMQGLQKKVESIIKVKDFQLNLIIRVIFIIFIEGLKFPQNFSITLHLV